MSLGGVVLPLVRSLFWLMMDRRPGGTPTNAFAFGGRVVTGSLSLSGFVSSAAAHEVAHLFGARFPGCGGPVRPECGIWRVLVVGVDGMLFFLDWPDWWSYGRARACRVILVGGVPRVAGLVLEVAGYVSPTRWRWRLSDEAGLFVADHEVDLGSGGWQVEAFGDLYGYLRRRVAPDQRLIREAEIVTEVGDWVGTELLGPVGVALAQRRLPVRLVIPPGAGAVGLLPWEIARVNGRVLAGHRVSVIVEQQPRHEIEKLPVGDRLRMLAIFSLPEGAGALNLRKERFELARLINNLARLRLGPPRSVAELAG
jgi:hypothetical protein